MNSNPVAITGKLLNLAGCFVYPSAEMAEQLQLDLTDLENNHVRLFMSDRGGVKAPPYAGCYLDSEDRHRFMINFNGLCLRHGVVLGTSHPPDHIPAMLEALTLLSARADDSADLDIFILLDTYYHHWPTAFAAALDQHDRTGFYAALGAEIKETLVALRHDCLPQGHQSLQSPYALRA